MKSLVSDLEPRPVDRYDGTIYMLQQGYLQRRLVRLFSFASVLPFQVLGLLPCLPELVCVVKEGEFGWEGGGYPVFGGGMHLLLGCRVLLLLRICWIRHRQRNLLDFRLFCPPC